MKVALIFSTEGQAGEDAILPFASTPFIDSLVHAGLAPFVIRVIADAPGDAAEIHWSQSGPRALPMRRIRLATFLMAETPDAIATFGREHHLAGIWPVAAANAPLVHCVSSWPGDKTSAPAIPASLASLAAARVKRASRHVDAVAGTSRAAIAGFLTDGYFANAAFSAVVPPPVGGAAGVAAAVGPPANRRSVPVFGVYAPAAAAAQFSFISHAVGLTGRPDAIAVRVATHNAPATAAARISTVAAGNVEDFVAAIDVLAVPAYDDTMVAALIAALRSGKPVIVPDRGGGAELIEYGRHGLMFCAGSAYHFANAMNLISQGWGEKPVLFATGGPAIARTQPDAAAASFVAVWNRAAASRGRNAARPTPGSRMRAR
jgi:hypothetical protein